MKAPTKSVSDVNALLFLLLEKHAEYIDLKINTSSEHLMAIYSRKKLKPETVFQWNYTYLYLLPLHTLDT